MIQNLIHKIIMNNKKSQLYDKLKVYFMAPCKRKNSGYIFITLDFFSDFAFPPLASRNNVFYSQKRSCYDGKGASHPHGSWPRASNVFESTYPKKENTSLSVNILLKIFQIVNPLSFWELMKKLNFFNVIIYGVLFSLN